MIKLPEDKVIITVAQTGALVTKKMNPGLPEQPDEIVESAYACYQEGAAIVHIHARDKNGTPTGSKEVFQEIHDKIRAKCPIIVQDSTGGRTQPDAGPAHRVYSGKTGYGLTEHGVVDADLGSVQGGLLVEHAGGDRAFRDADEKAQCEAGDGDLQSRHAPGC